VASFAARQRPARRIGWAEVSRAIAMRWHALLVCWLIHSVLIACGIATWGLPPPTPVLIASPAPEARAPQAQLSSFYLGDAARTTILRALRQLAPATALDVSQILAPPAPPRPASTGEVCRNYELNMAPLQAPNSAASLGLDCAPARSSTATPALTLGVGLSGLAATLLPFSMAAVLGPGATTRHASAMGLHWLLRHWPAVLAHAGLLHLVTFMATALFVTLPVVLAKGAWASNTAQVPWVAPAAELLASAGSALVSSLFTVFGLVYAARLCRALQA
jgi:hypothetical protein